MSCARSKGCFPISSPIRINVLPCFTELKMSRIERSKWNGACEEKRSSDVGLNVSEHHSTKLTALRCVNWTPFGLPVEPEV